MEIVDINSALEFSGDCDYIMHVEDFDGCEDKFEAVYDLVKRLGIGL